MRKATSCRATRRTIFIWATLFANHMDDGSEKGTRMADAVPVLDQLDLVVNDMEASLAFYRLVGLDIPDEAVWKDASGGHHAEIKMANGFELALNSAALTGAYNQGWSNEGSGSGRTNHGFRVASRGAVDARGEAEAAARGQLTVTLWAMARPHVGRAVSTGGHSVLDATTWYPAPLMVQSKSLRPRAAVLWSIP